MDCLTDLSLLMPQEVLQNMATVRIIIIYFLNIKITLENWGSDRTGQGGGARKGKEFKRQLTSVIP